MKLDNNQLHKVIEYIKCHSEGMVFDVLDVTENLDEVLNYYGFCLELAPEDREILSRELLPLAQEFQLREAKKLVLVER